MTKSKETQIEEAESAMYLGIIQSANKFKKSIEENCLANLRVAVVPTETGNGIDQSSSVEEILNCKETQLFPITDYFKAQNDDEFGLHYSFLIDIQSNSDLTGTNLKGVHYF